MFDSNEALNLAFNRSMEAARIMSASLASHEEEQDRFDTLAEEIHETNVEKGFWGEPEMMDKYVAKLALIHSELTEVLEALRKSQGADKVTEEFADVLIRTFDLQATLAAAGLASPNLYAVMKQKMEANKGRPMKHSWSWG